jgi:hypothetical protein
MNRSKSLNSLFYIFFVYMILTIPTTYANAIQHCTNGITKWNMLSSLKIKNINLQTIQKNNRITLTSTSAPIQKYIIRENSGRIYAETPSGRAYVQVCKSANNELIATTSILGSLRSVKVQTQGQNKGVIYVDGSKISFTSN